MKCEDYIVLGAFLGIIGFIVLSYWFCLWCEKYK